MSAGITLNTEQKAAFKAIEKFLEHPSANVFVLKGYAGTGKTFLMQRLAKMLTDTEQEFCMLASTGRAATVLKGKTGFETKTVHGELYNFSKVDGMDHLTPGNYASADANQMSLEFLVRSADEDKRVYIVDESSMLSSEASADASFTNFGSGNLLDDFFTVAGNNKIIFVGDPCQLPPVGQNISPALDTNWLAGQNRVAVSFTLQKIERVTAGNDILRLAAAIRQLSEQTTWERFPKLPAAGLNNVKLQPSRDALFEAYVKAYKASGPNETLAIARSNRAVQEINRAMRRELFGDEHMPLQIGEVLLVTQNNYTVPLSNGDFVEVRELGSITNKAGMRFQKVKVRLIATEIEFTLMLSLDAVNHIKGNLTEDQTRELMVDFSYRMSDKKITLNSGEYHSAMRKDEYLGCLKATYGYAVTCHKAQGGEWDNVFLFLEKSMYGMDKLELCKWWYTSITRARVQLNLENNWWIK
ncbi:ATP-dependent DNA helicase [Mucilaginibacter glaciei]|uniref:AAA family ATPase n=1 Tax=Mucilaginibacter glaciei TaxID=2772109 RepID=A0A926NXH1_9SPHI|nr:DEAD/DEAH box helicase [Mucilaginibacter glaciei]MBD1393628.1 AAA family ATPase [Mucilaginibacter glaciei]